MDLMAECLRPGDKQSPPFAHWSTSLKPISPGLLNACAVSVVLTCAFFVWKFEARNASAADAQHQHDSLARATPGGVMSLDVYAQDGDLHLLTGVIQDDARSLMYQRSGDAGKTWSP